jgi:hypothetical protein
VIEEPAMSRLVVTLLVLIIALPLLAADDPAYDHVIRGGRIVDGSGNVWLRGDVRANVDPCTYEQNTDREGGVPLGLLGLDGRDGAATLTAGRKGRWRAAGGNEEAVRRMRGNRW